MPLVHRVITDLSHRDYAGRRIAYWAHLTPNSIPMLTWLRACGAQVMVGSYDPNSIDERVAERLRSL
jgi:S-adenosylhomocysteine hydrolase